MYVDFDRLKIRGVKVNGCSIGEVYRVLEVILFYNIYSLFFVRFYGEKWVYRRKMRYNKSLCVYKSRGFSGGLFKGGGREMLLCFCFF